MFPTLFPTFSDVLHWGRRVNVKALKLISLTLLFLSFTPLASFHILFSSWDQYLEAHDSDLSNNDSDDENNGPTTTASSNLLSVLRNPNATLDEILTVVLLERANTFGGTTTTTIMAYHWAAVIPWILSMIFGFVVPLMLYIMSLIRSRRIQQERDANLSEYRIRRRREKVLAALSHFQVTLKECHRDTDGMATVHYDNHSNNACCWKIPHPGMTCKGEDTTASRSYFSYSRRNSSSRREGAHQRSVSSLCAICLNNYEPGQTVVWSSNSNCCHAFHLDCLVAWFAAKRRKQHLCPCCRQIFFWKHQK